MSKILIVDDSGFSRNMTKRALAGLGHEVLTANDGVSGLAAIESEQPDCVILDLLMPVLDGFGVLEVLQTQGDAAPPVVVVSADIQESTRERVLSLGAIQILNKPASKDQLLKVIGEMLSGNGQEAA